MQLPKFFQLLKTLDIIDPVKLPNLVTEIKGILDSYEADHSKLAPALFKLCEQVMKLKDIKNEIVGHYEELICTVIKISAKHQFKIGFDALHFVFNLGAEFYKTANLDPSLAFPIGKDRQLQQYSPAVGEVCDVVRPYITSTSLCGWTRGIVREIENGKYTIQYLNSQGETTTRENPWFAPLGTRMKDFDWRMALDIGHPIDVLLDRVWYPSTVAEVGEEKGSKKIRVTFRRFSETGDRVDSHGNRYYGLLPGQDEWMQVLSPRIQMNGKMVSKKLCYFSYKSDELIPDDQYDILFEEQYKQKPFYTMARTSIVKSVSILTFGSTFITCGGIQKLLQLLDDEDSNEEIVYTLLVITGFLTNFMPRMYVKESKLPQIYQKIPGLLLRDPKNLHLQKIDPAFFCYDFIGRRIFSLSEVHRDQNTLRRQLIKQFLKMNMEKQMIALRYLSFLVHPKKAYNEAEQEQFHNFLKDQNIFAQVFNVNIHEQILSRTVFLLQYMIKHEIITQKQFQSLWTIVPVTDTRGRTTIQRLLTDISKNIPMKFAEMLISKILQLKQTQLTNDNLNLLKELKNREIGTDTQMKILNFLWDILTVKSGNIKINIEEQVQKVFKAYISIIKDPKIRMKALQSMVQKLQQCKKIKNQIELLKDFIKSYPDKKDATNQMVQQGLQNIPTTTLEVVHFIKAKGLYSGLINQLSKYKDEAIKKDILEFLSFLFESDPDDVNPIIRQAFEKVGPLSIFFQWLNKLSSRSTEFTIDLFQQTLDFSGFENLSANGFQAIKSLILGVNQKKNNIKIFTTYQFKSQNKSVAVGPVSSPSDPVGPVTGDADKGASEKKKQDNKFIGPLLPHEEKKHIYVLISPFKLIGIKFLEHLLHSVKQANVYGLISKFIIHLITNLHESIQDKTEVFRKEFLYDIIRQIKNIVEEDKFDDKIKSKLEVYINLIIEIFGETEQDGLGNLKPHFEKVQGEKITLNIDNLFDKDSKKKSKQSLPKIKVVCNENSTLWSLKKAAGEIICQAPQDIDIIKYTDPMSDTNNGKSLSQLIFYDNENIKIDRKKVKPIPREDLLNEAKTDVSSKFEKIIQGFFNNYKSKEVEGLRSQDLQILSKQKWRGTLFKQKARLDKVFEDHDKDKKGYLNYKDFKNFFFARAEKNPSAVWVLLNFSGYLNNFKPLNSKLEPVNTDNLPRKILSVPQVYNLIFKIFANQKFKQLHLNFYRLLCMLQVNQKQNEQIQSKIYEIIEKQESVYALCYSLQVVNSQLAKRSQFYLDFWKRNGVKVIEKRINSFFVSNKSLYELDTLMKNQILPGLIKIYNMYISELLWKYKIVRFLNQNRMNFLELEDFVKKINQNNDQKEDESKTTLISKQLLELGPVEELLKLMYQSCSLVFDNLLRKFVTEKNDYLSKLLCELTRALGSLIGSNSAYHNFHPTDYFFGIRNEGMSNRRSVINLIYIYLFHSDSKTQREIQLLLNRLLAELPSQSKIQNINYFILLKEITTKYLQLNNETHEKDQFFISLGNILLNELFEKVEGQSRTLIISDKIIAGILSVIESIINKKQICVGLSWRIFEITEKCLFAYNIEERLKQLAITQEMLVKQIQDQHFKNYVKCKTEDNRNTAYNIVAKMHAVSPAIQPLFINNYILPIIKSISPEVRMTGSKNTEVGLKNFGSTCYMNSMLQVLNSVGPFRNSLMKCETDAPLINELKTLFASLFFSERIDYAPGNLLKAFVPPINPGIQQDTTEFLNFLFDQLQNSLSGTRYKRLLDEIFKGANTVQMICHSCGYKKENREEFFSFGVEIDGKYDLQAALQGSYQGQIINDYLCDSCKKSGETTKRNILSEIPNVMFIHLRRIVFNYDMFVNMKIHTRLQFPEELNIEPYTKQGVQLREQLGLEYMKNLAHNEQQAKKFEVWAEHGKPKDFYKMTLKGVIVHSGSADVGHYYSILPREKVWRKFDDSRISFFGTGSFQTECYGGTFTSQQWGSGSSGNAYVLVYEKVIKNPIEIEPLNSDMSEQPTVIQYDDIKTYNSPEDYRKLWLDNHHFMVETHLLDQKLGKGFINFVCRIIEDCPASPQKIVLVADIIYRISFHSGIVGNLLKILKQNSNSVTPGLLYSHIINDKPKTFRLLFSNQKPVREFMANFIHIVLIDAIKNGDANAQADAIAYTVELLNGMTGEVAKNWLRVDGYFNLLFLLISSSNQIPQLWKLLAPRNFISTLIDYVMQKQSPVRINPKNYSLGTKSNPMDFSSGISIILFYLKHSYGLTGKNYQVPSLPEHLLFHLNDNDVICLSHMEFYRKMLRQRQNLKELALIIQRLCIMNLQFSKAICQAVLETVCLITENKDQMQDISVVCLEILKIRDDFWINRAESLLGVGIPFVMKNNVMVSFDEERFVYTSTIYDIFPIECLFSYVYLYRLKNTLACFQLIKAIIQGCSVSDVAMKFLIRQPSPSYLYESFVSWMENFITTFIEFATTDVKVKERLQGEVEYIMKYVKDVKDYIKQHPEIDYHKSIITGEIAKKTEVNSFEKDGIQIKLYEYEVSCLKSEPIPSGGNLALKSYLQSYRLTRSVANNSNILRFFTKPAKAITLKADQETSEQEKELQGLFDTGQSTKKETEIQTSKENQAKVQPVKEKEPAKQVQKQLQQEVNVEGIEVKSYFRQLQATNKSKQKKIIKLTFSTDQYPNMIVPHEFVWKLFPKNTESLWMAKQDADKDWGNLQMKSHVEEYNKQKHEKKNITSWWFKTYGEKEANVEEKTRNKLDQMHVDESEGLKPEGPQIDIHKDMDFTEINCPVCTCFNPVSSMTCEACGSALH